jgi:hypothetical protein
MNQRDLSKLAVMLILGVVAFNLLMQNVQPRTVYVPESDPYPQVVVVQPPVVVVAAPVAAPVTTKAPKPARVKTPRVPSIPRIPGVRLVHHIIRL